MGFESLGAHSRPNSPIRAIAMLLTVSDLGETKRSDVEVAETDTVGVLKAMVQDLWHLTPGEHNLRCICNTQILEDLSPVCHI